MLDAQNLSPDSHWRLLRRLFLCCGYYRTFSGRNTSGQSADRVLMMMMMTMSVIYTRRLFPAIVCGFFLVSSSLLQFDDDLIE